MNMPFSKEDEKNFEVFFRLKEARQFQKSLSILALLKSKHPNSSVIFGLFASVYYELKDYKKSGKNFKKTLSIKPKSELASLGLFHCLMHQGRSRMALKEIHRFLAICKPQLYKITIEELADNIDNFESAYDRKIINSIYDKWGSH
jgi:tetratricopeptide (TPR) repeat protein